MKEAFGDLWKFHRQGHWVAITTNGVINRAGKLVMGRGTAAQAKVLFPNIDQTLADVIRRRGNVPVFLHRLRIATFPVKHHWYQPADLDLIRDSATTIQQTWGYNIPGVESDTPLYIPRPGCGNGRLEWSDVKPVIEEILDDRFIIVEREP